LFWFFLLGGNIMKAYLYNLATWVNSDPRRAKMLSVAALASLVIAAHLIPGAVAFAGPMGGGSDLGGG
jgi:hypothetical protein